MEVSQPERVQREKPASHQKEGLIAKKRMES
jgi:hypothetical protein